MVARIPIHVRNSLEGAVVVTPAPFTDLAYAGSSFEACVEALRPVLQERISSLDAVDRVLHAGPLNAGLLRVPVEVQHGAAGGDHIHVTLGVVTVDRPVGGHPLTLAYPVAVPGLEVLQKDGDRDKLVARLSKQLSSRLKSWSAVTVIAADEPLDTRVEILEVEIADGGNDPDFEFPTHGSASGILEELGVDLTRADPGRIDRREELVRRTLETLAAQGRSSVMLVGPADVGKTALIHEIARRIAAGEVPETLLDRAVWRISANELIAGAQYTGMWQDRVRRLVDQARRTRGIVAMGDPIGIIDAGRWSQSDNNVSRFLRPFVESGEITLVCECTIDQFSAAQRKEPSFVDAFHRIDVVEPTRAETLTIAADAARRLADNASIEIADDAITAAVELTKRFEPFRSFPGKSIRLLEDAVRERGENIVRIDRKVVTEAFSRRSGMPLGLLSDDVTLRVDTVREHFESRVLGQPEATEAMVEAVTVLKAGLNDPGKPLASFFFVGPTGVGKTELAKALAEFLFGSAERVVRLDMGEYTGGDAVQRLVGTAWGDGEGELTRRVREQPFCVVLLDEIEKAHATVFDALLAALGEGRLADAAGRAADFRNAIVIMTSNLGASRARSSGLGFGSGREAGADSHYIEEAEKFFRPEFFNRIDRIVVFHALAVQTVQRIARRELEKLLVREGITRRGLRIEIDDSVVDAVATKGFHPRYGARPLQREIERAVIGPLAQLLVERPVEAADFVRVHLADGEIAVSVEHVKTREPKVERKERRSEQSDGAFEKAERLAVEFSANLESDEASGFADELRPMISELIDTTHDPEFWRDAERARTTLQGIYRLEALVNRFDALVGRAAGLVELGRRVRETQNRARLAEITSAVESMSDRLLVLRLELAAATAGTDAGDSATIRIVPVGPQASAWARQLLSMYEAWAERTGRDAVVSELEGSPAIEIRGPATADLLAGEQGLHRHVRPDRTEVLARVIVESGARSPRSDDDTGTVARVYEEGKRRIVRDPRTGARESHVNAVLDDGRIDPFLIAWLRTGDAQPNAPATSS